MRRAAFILVGLVVLGSAATAEAQDKKPRGPIELGPITITGRIEKPIAAVDVSRIQPKLTLAELRQPFIDRIEKALLKEPF